MTKWDDQSIDKILVNRKIKRIEEYPGKTSLKMKWKCEMCGHEWYSSVNNVITSKHGCIKCAGKFPIDAETVDNLLKSINIKRIGNYLSYNKKMSVMCLICDYIWDCSLSNLKNGHKKNVCPKCSGMERINDSIIDERLKSRKIIRISGYVGPKDKMKWKCVLDGREWESTLNNVLRGNGCPSCSGKERLNNDIVDERIKDSNVIRLGEYVNNIKKMKWKCKICENVWFSSYGNISCGKSCPLCKKKNEKRLLSFLKSKYQNVLYQKNISINGKKLIIDFVVNDVFIEYNGRQHYQPIEYFGGEKSFLKQKERDDKLREYCKINNIKLLEIPYWLKEHEQYELIEKGLI